MIRQIGTPHAFMTHSAADIRWPDYHEHMPNRAPNTATESERQRLNAKNITRNENPAIAAWWFCRPWNLFFLHVMKPFFHITEWWFRYDWQHRGSSHVHVLFWMKDGPSPDALDIEDPESLGKFMDFWSSRVSAVNPVPNAACADIHPSAWRTADLTYSFHDLAQMLNRVQRHTKCTPYEYCLRRPKGFCGWISHSLPIQVPQGAPGCFHSRHEDSGSLRMELKRNDSLLNYYNPSLTLGWRANVDISPCTDARAVAIYIAKYALKAEKPSVNFGEVMTALSTRLDEDAPSRVIFQKLLGRILTERDYTAEDVCHQLLDCSMLSASREFGSLSLEENKRRQLRREEAENQGDAVEEQDWRDAYLKRSLDWKMSISTIGSDITENKAALLRNENTQRPISLWPLYNPSTDDPEVKDQWCRAKLLLHHPHRDTAVLRNEMESWSDAFLLRVVRWITRKATKTLCLIKLFVNKLTVLIERSSYQIRSFRTWRRMIASKMIGNFWRAWGQRWILMDARAQTSATERLILRRTGICRVGNGAWMG